MADAPVREYTFVTGVESGTAPAGTATPTDSDDLVTLGFVQAAANVVRMELLGHIATTYENISRHISDTTKTLARVRIHAENAGESGSTILQFVRSGPSGADTQTATLTSNSGAAVTTEVDITDIDLVANDIITLNLTQVAPGLKNLFTELYFSTT